MRGVIAFLLTLVVILVLGWVGAWWYVQSRIESGFQNWAEQQATHGITVAYSGIQRGASPTTALVTVTNLTITLPQQPDGAQPVVTLPTLGLRVEMTSLTVFHADLPNKISVNAGGNIGLVINSGSIALSEIIDTGALTDKAAYPFKGGDFAANDVDFLASSGSLLVLHVDSLVGHADINVNAAGGQPALAETITLNGLALSPLMTKVASIPFDGKINEFGLTLNLSGPVPPQIYTITDQLKAAGTDEAAQQKLLIPIIHQWASQGGTGSMGLTLAVGPSTASTDANIKFDANLQPEGAADLTANHLDAFASAITNAYPQAADSIAQAEAQLTPYITTDPTTGQTLTIHATYGTGSVSVNGTKVAPLPPLDWTTLENPPPAADPAPASSGQ
jgi:hypothetical protein